MRTLHIVLLLFTVVSVLHSTSATRNVCGSRIVDSINKLLNITNEHCLLTRAKRIIRAFLDQSNEHSGYLYNATRSRGCSPHQSQEKSYEEFISSIALKVTDWSPGTSDILYYRASVVSLVIGLRMENYVCSDFSNIRYTHFTRDLVHITHPNVLLRDVATKFKHNTSPLPALQCLNVRHLEASVAEITGKKDDHALNKRLSPTELQRQQLRRSNKHTDTHTQFASIHSTPVPSPWSIQPSTSQILSASPLSQTRQSTPKSHSSQRLHKQTKQPHNGHHNRTSSNLSSNTQLPLNQLQTIPTQQPSGESTSSSTRLSCYTVEHSHRNNTLCINKHHQQHYNILLCSNSSGSEEIRADMVYLCSNFDDRHNTSISQNMIVVFMGVPHKKFNETVFRIFNFTAAKLRINVNWIARLSMERHGTRVFINIKQDKLAKIHNNVAKPINATTLSSEDSSKNQSNLRLSPRQCKKLQIHSKTYTASKQEAWAIVILHSVLKGEVIQSRDMPCAVSVLSSLYEKYRKPTEPYLSIHDIEDLLRDLSGSNSEHDHSAKTTGTITQQNTAHDSHVHSAHDSHVNSAVAAHSHHTHYKQTCSMVDGIYNRKFADEMKGQKLGVHNLTSVVFGHTKTKVTMEEFSALCPGLLFMLLQGHQAVKNATDIEENHVTKVESYGIGSLCVFFISLSSLFGISLVKITGTRSKAYLLSFMMAMSVGCLVGDAIIHLLPSIFHGNGQSDDGHSSHTEGRTEHAHTNQYKLCGAVVTIHVFFLIQLIMTKFHKGHHHGKDQKEEISDETGGRITNNVKAKMNNQDYALKSSNSTNGRCMDRTESNDSKTEFDIKMEECVSEASASISEDAEPMVFMIIIGDCIHNFADGLAIGATFSLGMTEGISTSIAVLCHEIPHELGDFAVFLAAGYTVKKAVLVNMISSVVAFIGLYIGIWIGQDTEFRLWIIAAGAGMFLYVGLATMIPELIRIFRSNMRKEMFVSLNLGMTLGYGSMLLLAVFEEHIKF